MEKLLHIYYKGRNIIGLINNILLIYILLQQFLNAIFKNNGLNS